MHRRVQRHQVSHVVQNLNVVHEAVGPRGDGRTRSRFAGVESRLRVVGHQAQRHGCGSRSTGVHRERLSVDPNVVAGCQDANKGAVGSRVNGIVVLSDVSHQAQCSRLRAGLGHRHRGQVRQRLKRGAHLQSGHVPGHGSGTLAVVLEHERATRQRSRRVRRRHNLVLVEQVLVRDDHAALVAACKGQRCVPLDDVACHSEAAVVGRRGV